MSDKVLSKELLHFWPSYFLLQELEALKSELEDSLDTTAAVQDLRNKRESEVMQLKQELDAEAKKHEQVVVEFRSKHQTQLEAVNEQVR